MNYKEYVKKRLNPFKENEIIITNHVEIRQIQRQISKAEVIENIINPKRLEYAIKDTESKPTAEKFDCYFGYSKTQCHRYVLIIKKKVVVVTVIKINRRWQRIAEKRLR